MERVDGYDHQPGSHCGAGALRNVTDYYEMDYTEAACFGIGGGPAFVLYEHPDRPWVTFRTSPLWLERAFFERLGIPHTFRAGDDFETAWANVTGHIDDDDPPILFLDPGSLDYLAEGPGHVPPHAAAVVGYDEEAVLLSDASVPSLQELSRESLREAWSHDRFVPIENEYLVVTNARASEEGNDAAAAGLRQAATYMLAPLEVKRDARGPGEEGLPALRSFADYLGTWGDRSDSTRPVRAARQAIDEHGEGTAYRGLFAESLAELGQRTGLPRELADRMDDVGSEWRTVAEHLAEIDDRENPQPGSFEETATFVADIADQEESIFSALRRELGDRGE
ncbi:BtrH N-terminal domain-containing protein [Halolamina litorea]|uniref:BtrH N-terminal domain-containing protein n=1 Tax=Halolamina litorea TaxID=1515593 RepID=A0ABD6BWA5_9EURY|nr:BtrH N-terminal domain-containing protein [Halolamina litorea]